jgi:LCP family protein required for cell wall assembly
MRPGRVLTVFAAIVLVFFLACTFVYFSINAKLSRANVLTPYTGRPVPGAGTNWLITGSGSRDGLGGAEQRRLALGHDVTGARLDSVMVLHIPANGTRPVLVSIPRDSWVPVPGYGGATISAAYAIGGPALLAETVQDATGLYIGHYLGIGLDGLVRAVGAVGGVRMCLPAAYHDPRSALSLRPGCQRLSGDQAVAFVRTSDFTSGDLQREQDQRLLLAALVGAMTRPSVLLNPFTVIPAAFSVAATLDVDSGVRLRDLYPVAEALRDPVATTVPVGGVRQASAGPVVTWSTARARELFGDLAADKAVPGSLLSGTSLEGTR